jgi:hypothetical protein
VPTPTRETLAFMRERGLIPIFWPALSPNLNPIETLRNRIKDIIEEKDPEFIGLILGLGQL